MPPTTTPASTTIVSRSAKVDVTSGCWTVSITATIAARIPETSTAEPITRFARTPMSRAVWKSIAAARICSPTVVRPRNSTSATRQTAAVTIATTVIFRTSVPKIVQGRLSFASDAAGSPSVSSRWSMRSAIACRRNATANVATSIVAGDCVRSGRKTTWSIAIESAITTAKHRTIPSPDGPVAVGREREREGAGHDELAVREVDEAEHAEDEADPDRHQRVDRADADRVDLHLRLDRRAEEVRETAGEDRGHGPTLVGP